MARGVLTILAMGVFIVVVLVGALTVLAGDSTAFPLVQISGTSPFGALENCGNFPGTVGAPGTAFVDSEVEPWVDVNPTDPDNIVAFWQQDRWSNGGARGNVAGVSFDGGAIWQIVVIPGITDCSGGPWERASDPWVSFSPDGTLHQMSLVFDIDPLIGRIGFGPNGMVVSKSEDGGLTWNDPITLVEDTNPLILNDKNSLTADPTDANYVYAVWDRLQVSLAQTIHPENIRPGRGTTLEIEPGFRGPVYFARSTDGGDSWEPAREIYDPGINNQTIGSQIVVLPNGTVIEFFTEILNLRIGTFIFLSVLRSDDKGETWRPRLRPIRTNRLFSEGAVTPDDLVRVRDGSILFDVAVDPVNGDLYAVWQDTRFSGIEEIAFSMSTNGGLSWSDPIKINQTPPNPDNSLRAQAFLPSVAVSEDGGVLVTYYDFRNDDDVSGELTDYFAVQCDSASDCTDPADWGNEVRLTENSFDYLQAPFADGLFLGDYMGLASDGPDFLPVFGIAGDMADAASMFSRRVTPGP